MILNCLEEKKITSLKKNLKKYIFLSIILIVLSISFFIITIFVQNRETMNIYIIVGWIFSFFTMLLSYFILISYILPEKEFLKKIDIQNRVIQEEILKIEQISKDETISMIEYNVYFAKKEDKTIKILVRKDFGVSLEINKKYKIKYNHLIALQIEEVPNE